MNKEQYSIKLLPCRIILQNNNKLKWIRESSIFLWTFSPSLCMCICPESLIFFYYLACVRLRSLCKPCCQFYQHFTSSFLREKIPKGQKDWRRLDCIFCDLGSECIKAARKMLVKSKPVLLFHLLSNAVCKYRLKRNYKTLNKSELFKLFFYHPLLCNKKWWFTCGIKKGLSYFLTSSLFRKKKTQEE